MNREAPDKKQAVVVALDGELTIKRAQQLRDLLQAQMPSGKQIILDLSAVNAIDISGLQLICSTHKTAKNTGGNASILPSVSPAVLQTVRNAGFARSRGCQPDSDFACMWNVGERV